MDTPFRITGATLDVAQVLLETDRELHGFAIAQSAGKPTGSVYPILARMEEAGWLESHWETEHPQQGKPRRRFYSLSKTGRTSVRRVMTERRP